MNYKIVIYIICIKIFIDKMYIEKCHNTHNLQNIEYLLIKHNTRHKYYTRIIKL
jgi:hypothetical protein